MLLKVLDRRLLARRGALFPDQIQSALTELKQNQLKTHFLAQKYLKMIVPITNRPIDISRKLKHPVVFFIKEDIPLISKKTVEQSRLMDAVLNLVSSVDGSFKFFDSSKDTRYLQKTDYVTYMGPHGEKAIQTLRTLGYDFKSLSPTEVFRKYGRSK